MNGYRTDTESKVLATYGRVTPHIGIEVMLKAMRRVEARKAAEVWSKSKFLDDNYLKSFD